MDGIDAAPPPAPIWAKVEIFGHRQHFGRVSEVEQFGAKMMRVDVPLPRENAAIDGEGNPEDRFATFYYGGGSIFSFTPMTEEAARRWAEHERRNGAADPIALMPPEPYRRGGLYREEGDDEELPL